MAVLGVNWLNWYTSQRDEECCRTHFKGRAFGSNQPLSSLDEPLLVPDQCPNFDDVTCNVIL